MPTIGTGFPTIGTNTGFFPQQRFTFQLSGPISASNPQGGIFADGGAACTFLSALGFECTLAGAADAVRQGLASFSGGIDPTTNGGAQCTDPFVYNPTLGICVFPGSPVSGGGGAQMGMFGAPAVAPTVVGQRSNSRGEVVPIRQCPMGTVLGKDDLCYAKGSIPRRWRKWKPARKPPITASDARAIRKAARAKDRVKKLAGEVGFSCKKR